MVWRQLEKTEQINEILNLSNTTPLVVFKHSTRCIISKMALDRLERQWSSNIEIPFYYLDLLNFRNISNQISEITGVEHQSPQILVIKNSSCVFTSSHGEINLLDIVEATL